MNKTIWKIAIRNIWKKKSFSITNILALALGFVGFIIISLFIQYEFNWDKSNENFDRIFRVQRVINISNATNGNNISPHTHAITASLIENHAAFEKVSVINEYNGKFLSITPEKQIYGETGICADNNFFDVFTYKFSEGLMQNALAEPFSIVLSESMAKKLFGMKTALGKTVVYEKKVNLKVTGVYSDLPLNSSVRPSYILSFSTLKRTENIERNKSWNGNSMIYGLLKNGANIQDTEAKIKDAYSGFKDRELEKLQLCPLSKIHLSFNGQKDLYVILMIFALTGLFILVMSAFNYINFTISNSSTRGKEIAIKKLLGANNYSLFSQFQAETLLLSVFSVVIALLVVKLIIPLYNSLVNTSIALDLFGNWQTILSLIFISVLIGFLSGIYPSLVMSSYRIVKLLKNGMFASVGKKVNVKKVLVVFQFSVSIILVSVSMFFVIQVNYLTNKDLGFNKEEILYTQLTSSESNGDFEVFRNRLLQNPEIINASLSQNLPFVNSRGGRINWEGASTEDEIFYRPNWISFDFIENMQIDVVEGRGFSKDFPSDINGSCIINETAKKYFGWDNPIGKRINNNKWTIVGVVKDYHLMDIHNVIDPAVLLLSSGDLSGQWVYAIRYASGTRNAVKQILSNEFNAQFPNDPYEFNDLDTAFLKEDAYLIYQTIKKSLLFFTVFIIFLAIIALLGMVSYTTLRRTKEIGIRKINGSTVKNLFLLLNKDFVILLAISVLIAWPIAFVTYGILPGNFKLPLPYWVFFASTTTILVIIFISTSWHIFKAVKTNPIESLRYE